jgi:voltage-gated potassium channel
MIGENSDLISKNLIDSNLRKNFGVIIVAIKKMDGNMVFNPMPSETFEAGDVIVVLGKREDLRRMNAVM